MKNVDTPKIAVLLAAEESLDAEGGAVATWVANVYHKTNVTIIASRWNPHWAPDLDVVVPRNYATALAIAGKLASLLSRITGKPAPQIRRLLLGNGRFWQLSVQNLLRHYDLIHIHNRPQYGPGIRSRGFSGILLNHMHNDHLESWSKRIPDLVLKEIFDFHIFCSDYILSRTSHLYPDDISTVVYNGIPKPNPQAIELPPLSNAHLSELRLVTAGRLIPEKGILESIQVCSSLNDQGRKSKLVIYGASFSGNSHHVTPYVQSISKLIDETNAKYPDSVILGGFLAHEDLLVALSRADLFLYPCQWDEPFGMVLAEAMSVGTACIAPRRGGIPEIIDETTGFLVDADATVDDYVNTILEATDFSSIGIRAQDSVVSKFLWTQIRSDIFTLYDRLFKILPDRRSL